MFFNVQIEVNGTWEISRVFETLRAARSWAKWTAKKWPTKISQGIGGIEVK